MEDKNENIFNEVRYTSKNYTLYRRSKEREEGGGAQWYKKSSKLQKRLKDRYNKLWKNIQRRNAMNNMKIGQNDVLFGNEMPLNFLWWCLAMHSILTML